MQIVEWSIEHNTCLVKQHHKTGKATPKNR
jgi:hypothetical protein